MCAIEVPIIRAISNVGMPAAQRDRDGCVDRARRDRVCDGREFSDGPHLTDSRGCGRMAIELHREPILTDRLLNFPSRRYKW